MTSLSTIEQGLYQELLVNGVKSLVTDFKQTAKSYGLPTNEESILKLLVMVAEIEIKKLKDEETVLDELEVPF